MKKSSWKSPTFALALSMGIILCALPSCKSHEPMVSNATHNSKFLIQNSHDTVVQSDSVVLHDSVIYRERTVHDTVYVTKEVYRDRLEARGERRKAERNDTIVVTEYRDRVIEHPPEKYVPKFYKWCTIAFWVIGLLAMGYGIVRWRMRR